MKFLPPNSKCPRLEIQIGQSDILLKTDIGFVIRPLIILIKELSLITVTIQAIFLLLAICLLPE